MDVLKAVQTYLFKLLNEAPGMKVLLLDAHTTPIVSVAITQTELLAHEVYLTDRIDNTKRDPLPHLSCIAFLSTSDASVAAVQTELEKPRYSSYWLYFSNTLRKSQIEQMAAQDEFEVVREIQEYFADYAAPHPSLFTLTPAMLADGGDGPPNPPLYLPSPLHCPPHVILNHQRAILALLLSLKKKPVIRWEKMSSGGKKLAMEIQAAMTEAPYKDLFDFRPTSGPSPLLLILDRRNDPVTPLLSQWTYQAMVHELVGIQNGRVKIETEEKPELRDLVLSASSDPFFASQLFSNFGDLGAALASYVLDYQSRTSTLGSGSASRIETVADMKRFVEEYPEFRKLGGNVSKHVALVGELSRLIERDDLLAVSEVEQSLASQESHAADLKSVINLLSSAKVPAANKLRLAALYALRYQKMTGNAIPQVVDTLIANGVAASRARLVYVLLNLAGADQRQDDLFMNENLFSRGKSALRGLKGVENVYTQHTPHLSETLDLLLKGRLKETSYPFVDGDDGARTQRPQDIIVFMLGGTTYEETRAIAMLNDQLSASGTRILLGGSCVHNSTSFIDMIESAAEHYPQSIYNPPTAMAPPTSTYTAPPPPPSSNAPAINLRAGGYELNVGGAAGSGLYRASGPGDIGASFQIPEGLKDGAGRLWGTVRQRVEERVSRVSTPQS